MCFFKKKDDELMQIYKASRIDTEKSVNYQFACVFMRDYFYNDIPRFIDVYYGKDERIHKAFLVGLNIIHQAKRLRIPESFLSMPVDFIEKDGTRFIVVSIPEARQECECNYIALVETAEQHKRYYTSEYYAHSKEFGLCYFASSTEHHAMSTVITSKQQFIDEILKIAF